MAIEKKHIIISLEKEKGNQRAMERVIPTIMAIPPNVGVGNECSFRESGYHAICIYPPAV
jgi:hypothetical protein